MALCIVELIEESIIPLKGFIRKRVANEEDAEDILQDVFIKLLSNIDKLADNQKMNAWIYKITRNTIVDCYRRNQKSIEYNIRPEELAVPIYDDLSSNLEIASCLKNMIDELPRNINKPLYSRLLKTTL